MKTRSFEWKENSPQWNSSSGWTVWTAPNSPIMIQRIEPGGLSIEEAEELIEVLQSAVEFQKTSWKPKLGALAEHIEYGRVLVIGHDLPDTKLPWHVLKLEKPIDNSFQTVWCSTDELLAPKPRLWNRAEDVPAHIVVTDQYGSSWSGTDLHSDLAPFTELLPEGDVW